ncbi:uncharacterized protein LOC143532543 [Bidens hawaiensis]|uniref:uncharacterized protein LOC143532543 n=1 Tax=Bidens hawaiensis TaxID=980011 RepID=UPI00404AB7D1
MGDTTPPPPPKGKENGPSSVQCPMLTTTNYNVWAMRMKVVLRVHKVWDTINSGVPDEEKNDMSMALLFQSIPETVIMQIGDQETAKAMWDSIKTRLFGAERVREARLQTLSMEFDNMKMNESDSIDNFAVWSLCIRLPGPSSKGSRSKQNEARENFDDAAYMHQVMFLNEQNLIPKKYETERVEDDVWYLDNGASNHMTGNRSYFLELNENITGRVKFGDGSFVQIKGKGSILFQGKSCDQDLLTEIYYIPELKSNIISLGQATESGCDIRMKHDLLTMYDENGRLLMKVKRSKNRLYKIRMKI